MSVKRDRPPARREGAPAAAVLTHRAHVPRPAGDCPAPFQPSLPVDDIPPGPFRGLVGRSPEMRRLFREMAQVAPLEMPVLILGESGTGKERVARALHDTGPRARGPFVPVHCAAIPEPLLEGELFGHVRGAFTGAERERAGLVESARGGTLFLDEVGELPAAVQVKILRLLQEREVRRLGESAIRHVDLRIVSATHRDLRREAEAGRFREDLFYRLHVFPLHVPPLRARGEDLWLLARQILARAAEEEGLPLCTLGPGVAEWIRNHRWPGNVRELENALRTAVVRAGNRGMILPEDLPGGPACESGPAGTLREALRRVERETLLAALESSRGNRSAAARALGISRQSLHEKIRRFGIVRPVNADAT